MTRSSALLQCPANLSLQDFITDDMDGRPLQILCSTVRCYFQLRSLTPIRTEAHVPSSLYSSFLFMFHLLHLYSKMLSTQARKKLTFIFSGKSDSHTSRNLLQGSTGFLFLAKKYILDDVRTQILKIMHFFRDVVIKYCGRWFSSTLVHR